VATAHATNNKALSRPGEDERAPARLRGTTSICRTRCGRAGTLGHPDGRRLLRGGGGGKRRTRRKEARSCTPHTPASQPPCLLPRCRRSRRAPIGVRC